MPHVKLTDRTVQALPAPESGRTDYFDADGRLPGFGLRMSASGRKTWVLVYRHAGKPRRLTLGPYPHVGVADARTRAKEALAAIVQGEDPAGEKRAAREAATFADLAREYLERHAKARKRSWREDERILRVYVPKAWHQAKADTITRRDVRELLADIAERAPIMANRVLACLRKLFNFGLRWELVEKNPCAMVERPAPERQRERVLTADELRAVWSALDGEDAHTASLFKLHLLTMQRGGEVKAMRWEDTDLEDGWWTIPAERSKNKLAHRVPLSAQALAVLHELQRTRAEGSPWVFPSTSASGFRATVQKPMRRLRAASGVAFVPHDLRRTAATFLTSELGVSRLVVSKLLNHVETGVTKVYDRASYDPEKRAALKAWGTRLEAIVSGERSKAKVVALRA